MEKEKIYLIFMESLAFFPRNCDHKWTFPDYLCRTDPLPDVGLIKGLREGKGGGGWGNQNGR